MNECSILIVEDEAIVAFDLAGILEKLGYKVTGYLSEFDEVVRQIQKELPDLVLMDINLNASYDGIDMAEFLLEKYNIPVLYITANSDECTVERAAKTQPLGYILKPFCENDIRTNLQLAQYKLNRQKKYQPVSNLFHLGEGYSFDRASEKLYHCNVTVPLGKNELQLLLLLIDANGGTVTFEMIENLIYQDNPISTSTVRTLIYRLRTKLNCSCIETVSGIGCKISLE
ncbi:response regulator [Sulfurimonas sp. HSL-3221]|uniref:response regulator n=1 Tax=Sulfurimonadaceae TaxID=2771471 RepID=UPI001E2FBD02|nr:response regulator [Sulfurimonas sp. HSL-3221]UFS61971.1 response regulator [Sulfurimonas sp. HSL-3221]